MRGRQVGRPPVRYFSLQKTAREMRTSSFLLINILFFIVLDLSPRIQVNSQAAATDSCASTFDLKRQLLFDTTSLVCRSVWDVQGFILRVSDDPRAHTQTPKTGKIYNSIKHTPIYVYFLL